MGKRIFVFVIDGFGIGEAPDAKKYGDIGSNTFVNIEKVRKLHIPTLSRLGIKNIDGINLIHTEKTIGAYGKMQELSVGKDTTTGHFEMMGIVSKYGMPTYPNGFPIEIIEKLENAFGTKIIGNCTASGTEIIKQLGKEHIETKKPIVYTSADSVLQIATHTDVYSIEELYSMCEKARKIMCGKDAVGRVIARPFATENGEFVRLGAKRRDFSLSPEKPNTMQKLYDNNFDVIAVGKIEDIFNNESITKSYVNHTNKESLEIANDLLKVDFNGMAFVNLVDTDMLFGHRNDIEGYADSLEKTDIFLNEFIKNMKDDDILIVTGDHGNDPTTISSDHSREYTPLLIYYPKIKPINMGILQGFYSIGQYIEKIFGLNSNSKVFEILKGANE